MYPHQMSDASVSIISYSLQNRLSSAETAGDATTQEMGNNKILTFNMKRECRGQDWGLVLKGGWHEGEWIQIHKVNLYYYKNLLLYIKKRW